MEEDVRVSSDSEPKGDSVHWEVWIAVAVTAAWLVLQLLR